MAEYTVKCCMHMIGYDCQSKPGVKCPSEPCDIKINLGISEEKQ